MSLRPRGKPPRGTYRNDHFHGRYICGRCSGEVESWTDHNQFHDELDGELEYLRNVVEALLRNSGPGTGEWRAEQVDADDGLAELADRARAEGIAAEAAGETARASFLRGGLGQVRDVLRIRPPARMEAHHEST